MPASATAGRPASFAVSPFDDWSALGATSWSFGDGATATGAGVSPTYAAPGTYTVVVRSADAVGKAALKLRCPGAGRCAPCGSGQSRAAPATNTGKATPSGRRATR